MAASLEQIETIAQALKVSTERLAPSGGSPVFNSENLQGDHANNYIAHNGSSTDAKDETITALKSALAAKDALLAAKEEALALLRERLAAKN